MRFPALPPKLDLAHLSADRVLAAIQAHPSPVLADGRYLHWDEFRRRPMPEGRSPELSWLGQSLTRLASSVSIPGFVDTDGLPFRYCRLHDIDRATHLLDRKDAARAIIETLGDEAGREQYRIDQRIEEAINSSLIEGAKLTTRAEAKAMIRDRRAPASRGETMVLNNYEAMKRLLDIVGRALTLDDLLEIHAILGSNALDSPDAEGRLRTAADNVRVEDATTGEVWFTPPSAAELRPRLEAMLAFANEQDNGPFVHPLIRAIVLHFWLAYLHPFLDGNGRMARALFYWQMLRSGYDFAQYLSISGPIDRAPRAYYLAFVHSETDQGDLTYFVLHQLGVLKEATDELLAHLRTRADRLRAVSKALSSHAQFNHRQQAVLAFLVRKPHHEVTVKSHESSHGVSYLTARSDLQSLEDQGLLRRVRVGRTDRYLPTEMLMQKLAVP